MKIFLLNFFIEKLKKIVLVVSVLKYWNTSIPRCSIWLRNPSFLNLLLLSVTSGRAGFGTTLTRPGKMGLDFRYTLRCIISWSKTWRHHFMGIPYVSLYININLYIHALSMIPYIYFLRKLIAKGFSSLSNINYYMK